MSSALIKKLLALSVFCFALEMFRMMATESLSYLFLPFNLILAWIPLGFATLARKEGNHLRLFGYLLCWLIFFPNAPSIITDLIHLKPRNDFPLWFDSTLIYSFAFTGLIIGMLSAGLIYKRLKEIFPKYLARAMMLFVMLMAGYGIYVGRFLRWNSWNVVADPLQIFTDTVTRIIHPFEHPTTYGVTFMTGVLLCMVFLVFESLEQQTEG